MQQDEQYNEFQKTWEEMVMDTPLFKEIYKKLKFQRRIKSVSRRTLCSKDEFHLTVKRRSYPILFTNVFPAENQESVFRKLLDDYGDFKIQARVGAYQSPEIYAGSREYKKISMRDYVKKLLHTEAYAGNQLLPPDAPEKLGISPPPFYDASYFESPALWLGGSNTATPLHKDPTDNFIFQIVGRKTWTLFPVRDVPNLYMKPVKYGRFGDFAISTVDIRNPDLKKCPNFALAKSIQVTVEPGEMLYLPAGWVHHVLNLDISLMMNFWVKLGNVGLLERSE
jgi:hypothetical protein